MLSINKKCNTNLSGVNFSLNEQFLNKKLLILKIVFISHCLEIKGFKGCRAW